MAKKKKRTKKKGSASRSYVRNPKTTKKKKRKNPYGGRMLSGLSFKTALKDQIPIQIGMLAAQWAAKRFGPSADETDPTTWAWSSYAKGGLGALAAAMVANMIKPGIGQRVLSGGLAHVVHRLIRNEIIEQSPTAIGYFGADDGIYVDNEGSPYMSSQGQYLPLDERHRLSSGMGETLVSLGPLGQVEPVGPLGTNDYAEYARAYTD